MTIPFLPDLPWALLGRFCFMGLPTNLWVVSGWEFPRASMENECIPMQSRVWVVCQNDPGPQEHRDASAYYPPFAVPAQGVCLREASLFPGRRSAINSSAIGATQGQPAELLGVRQAGTWLRSPGGDPRFAGIHDGLALRCLATRPGEPLHVGLDQNQRDRSRQV